MKNLWMVLPPLMADNFGMIEVLRHSDGCGVIDDSGDFRLGASRHGGPDTRVAVSGASNTDVITGTKEKGLEQAREMLRHYQPSFMLFSAGPCGATIGTDLGELAEEFSQESGVPCGVSELTGQKTYDVGISKTLEGMAKLLARPAEVREGTINLIGATTLDWSQEDMDGIRVWAEQQGYQVLSQPGAAITASQLRQMAEAEINLVLTVSGLAMARYLQKNFGTPCLALAPFGTAACQQFPKPVDFPPEDRSQTTLIIGEQFAANAIRLELERLLPGETAQVCTFYQMDKAYIHKGDRKLKGEADARELLASGQFRRVIADPLLRSFAAENVQWIDLPHRALHTYGTCDQLSLLGENCDNWLRANL